MAVLVVFGVIVVIGTLGVKPNQKGFAVLALIGLIATVWHLTS